MASTGRLWKLPPRAKVFEAFSAVADGRITYSSPTTATVTSSSLDKAYAVRWSVDYGEITADDNASRWQGYLGYPAIAVLMQKGVIQVAPEIVGRFRGVPWKSINTRHKNNWDAALAEVLDTLKLSTSDRAETERAADDVMKQLEARKPRHLSAGEPTKTDASSKRTTLSDFGG